MQRKTGLFGIGAAQEEDEGFDGLDSPDMPDARAGNYPG